MLPLRYSAFLFIFISASQAILPPGYEDVMHCPPEYCDREVNITDSPGFVGPLSSFHECYMPSTGEVVDEVWTGSLSQVTAPQGWVASPKTCTNLSCPSGSFQVGTKEQAGVTKCILCLQDTFDFSNENTSCGIACLNESVCACGDQDCCIENPCCYPCEGAGSIACTSMDCSFDPPDCGITICVDETENSNVVSNEVLRCEDNPNFEKGRSITCDSIANTFTKSFKSSKSSKAHLCSDDEFASNCPMACGLCPSLSTETTTNSQNSFPLPFDVEIICTCFDVTQLQTAVQAILNDEVETSSVSCDPGSHYKSITYQLYGQDPNFPYRYGVSGASGVMQAECFVSDMHFEIADTVYNACKSIMDAACSALGSV